MLGYKFLIETSGDIDGIEMGANGQVSSTDSRRIVRKRDKFRRGCLEIRWTFVRVKLACSEMQKIVVGICVYCYQFLHGTLVIQRQTHTRKKYTQRVL